MTSSLGFQTSIDIINRALQHCRMRRIASLTDSSANAQETAFVFDKLREAELRCNLWRFAIRRAILRPLDTTTAILATSAQTASGTTLTFASTSGVVAGQLVQGTNIATNTTVSSFTSTTVILSQAVSGVVALGAAITFGPLTLLWTPPTYAAGTTYSNGQVVKDTNGEWWESKVNTNLGNTPRPGSNWMHYVGPDTLQAWLTTTSYFTGELVLGSDANVYMSLLSQNGDGTTGHDPTSTSGFWLRVNGSTTTLTFFYPIGTGPATDVATQNVYRLPHGFLRQAPSSPKGGANPWLGAPRGNMREDWVFENDYVVTSQVGALMLRYVANVVDVPEMDAMFCEMLSSRIAEETAPLLVADRELLPQILSNIRQHYRSERFRAVTVNGIEIGPTDPDLDDYITVRS